MSSFSYQNIGPEHQCKLGIQEFKSCPECFANFRSFCANALCCTTGMKVRTDTKYFFCLYFFSIFKEYFSGFTRPCWVVIAVFIDISDRFYSQPKPL